MRQWLDRSPSLLLAVCSCGWRKPALDDSRAWADVAAHLRLAHDPDADRHARAVKQALFYARRATYRSTHHA